jgi:hypothetical protein
MVSAAGAGAVLQAFGRRAISFARTNDRLASEARLRPTPILNSMNRPSVSL